MPNETDDPRRLSGTPAAPPARPGFTSPVEEKRRKDEDKVLDNGIPMGSSGIRMIDKHLADDAAAKAPVSGGFAMDVRELKSVQAEWADIAVELQRLQRDATRLSQVRRPADEDASNMQIQAARSHAVLYAQKLQEQFDYADAYAKALQQAIDGVQGQDHAAAEAARNAGKG